MMNSKILSRDAVRQMKIQADTAYVMGQIEKATKAKTAAEVFAFWKKCKSCWMKDKLLTHRLFAEESGQLWILENLKKAQPGSEEMRMLVHLAEKETVEMLGSDWFLQRLSDFNTRQDALNLLQKSSKMIQRDCFEELVAIAKYDEKRRGDALNLLVDLSGKDDEIIVRYLISNFRDDVYFLLRIKHELVLDIAIEAALGNPRGTSAIDFLGEMGGMRAFEALKKIIASRRRVEVRTSAVCELRKWPHKEVYDFFIEMLKVEKTWQVRSAIKHYIILPFQTDKEPQE